jgi:hypothetical protein
MMGKKKLKYKPIKQNETLDIAVAVSQASALLDQAAVKAIKEDDSFMLIDIADKWIQIAKIFTVESESCENMDTDSETKYGFSMNNKEEVTDEDE